MNLNKFPRKLPSSNDVSSTTFPSDCVDYEKEFAFSDDLPTFYHLARNCTS